MVLRGSRPIQPSLGTQSVTPLSHSLCLTHYYFLCQDWLFGYMTSPQFCQMAYSQVFYLTSAQRKLFTALSRLCYVCTCLCATIICADALIRTRISKHIHLASRFNLKDSKTVDGHNETSLNQTMDLQDDVTSPIEDIQVHDPSVKQPYLRTYKKHHRCPDKKFKHSYQF